MNFIKRQQNKIKKVVMLLLMLLSIFILRKELKAIDMQLVQEVLRSKSWIQILGLLSMGVLAFNGSFVYDFYLSRSLDLSKRQVYKIAWISQAFSYFIGMFGLTGAYLRQDLYQEAGIGKDRSLKVAISVTLSSLVGLCFLSVLAIMPLYRLGYGLYIPFLVLLFLCGLAYIFLDSLYALFGKEKSAYLTFMTRKERMRLSLLSLVEWSLATAYFVLCMRFFGGRIDLYTLVLIYITSVLLGLLSMIPGGFGSFDATVLLLASHFGLQSINVVPALLLYRLGYYILPFLTGGALLLHDKTSTPCKKDPPSGKSTRKLLALLLLIVSIILILSATTPSILARRKLLKALFSRRILFYSRSFTALLGIILGIFSRGIYMGVRKTYYASIIISLVLAGLCLLKGLDYEEAFIMLGVALLLLANKASFTHPAPAFNRKSMTSTLLFAALLMLLYVGVYNLIFKVSFISGLEKFSLHYLSRHWLETLLYMLVAILISMSLTFSRKYYDNTIRLSPEKFAIFEKIRKQYPNTPYTQLFYMRDKDLFVNQSETLFFMYKAYENHVFVLGDPVGDVSALPEALDEFSKKILEEDRLLSFYQVTATYMEDFVEAGFKFLKLGENALIPLEAFNMKGKQQKNMRKIYNKIAQKNLTFEILTPPHSKEVLDEIEELSTAWLAGKKEMGYSLGAFDRDFLNTCKLYTLVNAEGQIEVFANDLAVENTKTLTIDMMRFDPKGETSVMEMLLLSIILWAQEHDYLYFDLGMAPLSNVGCKEYSPFKEKLVHIGYNYGNSVYGFKGLRHYKEKFKPEWKNIYLAYRDDKVLAETLYYLARVCHNAPEKF